MKYVLAILLSVFASCALFKTQEEYNPIAAADELALYRLDIQDVVFPVASPELQAKLQLLDAALLRLEAELRAGAPRAELIATVLEIATEIADESNNEDVKVGLGLLRVLIRHSTIPAVQELDAAIDTKPKSETNPLSE